MKLKVQAFGETKEFAVPTGAKLLDYLNEKQIHVNSSCAGKGTCQKCRVKILEGFAAPTRSDRLAFSEAELTEGWRLSCQCLPRTNIEVLVPEIENPRARPEVVQRNPDGMREPVLICDLGSTGVVVAVADRARFAEPGGLMLSSTGSGIDVDPKVELPSAIEAHSVNRQIRHGADVMTRLASAQKLGVQELQKPLLETLRAALEALVDSIQPKTSSQADRDSAPSGAEVGPIRMPETQKMFCSGNSAMVSFLNQWSIESLAVSPFQPVTTDAGRTLLPWTQKLTQAKLFEDFKGDGVPLETLPLLAGFVGADTVAGILWLEANGCQAPWMLVDIGTNTEIVLKTQDGHYWMTSAPAGPAFEGGNISSGMRAAPGAISGAQFVKTPSSQPHMAQDQRNQGAWHLETIGNDKPRGLCGSGLMDVILESLRAGMIHEDGLVPDKRIFVTPSISLVADDIREFQLAKSATRTAVDLLIERAMGEQSGSMGSAPNPAGAVPQKLYLAGTFAQHLKLSTVRGLGLLPQNIAIEQIGNSSLKGTWVYASLPEEVRKRWIENLQRKKRHVELALQDDFQHAFVNNLNFDSRLWART